MSIWFDGMVWALGGGFAVYLLRTVEPSKLWMVAGLLGLPIIAIHLPPIRRPVAVFVADAAWIVLVFSCIRVNRTLGTWAAIVCAVCATGLRLDASTNGHAAAEHSALPQGAR